MIVWKRKKSGRAFLTSRGDGGHQNRRPSALTKQGTDGLTETETAGTGPTWVCTRFSAYVIDWYYCRTPDYENKLGPDSFTCYWVPFPSARLVCQTWI